MCTVTAVYNYNNMNIHEKPAVTISKIWRNRAKHLSSVSLVILQNVIQICVTCIFKRNKNISVGKYILTFVLHCSVSVSPRFICMVRVATFTCFFLCTYSMKLT